MTTTNTMPIEPLQLSVVVVNPSEWNHISAPWTALSADGTASYAFRLTFIILFEINTYLIIHQKLIAGILCFQNIFSLL